MLARTRAASVPSEVRWVNSFDPVRIQEWSVIEGVIRSVTLVMITALAVGCGEGVDPAEAKAEEKTSGLGSIGSPVGHYVLDLDALVRTFATDTRKEIEQESPSAAPAEIDRLLEKHLAEIRERVSTTSTEYYLAADGSLARRVVSPTGVEQSAGRWSVVDEKIILTRSSVNGESLDPPDVVRGIYRPGEIQIEDGGKTLRLEWRGVYDPKEGKSDEVPR